MSTEITCPKCKADVLKCGAVVQTTSYQCYFPTNGKLVRKHAARGGIENTFCIVCNSPLFLTAKQLEEAIAA